METSKKKQKEEKTAWKAFEERKDYREYAFPLVTVVIPTYNCVQSIAMTLDSVLKQEYPHFEVVIIDAESTDRTLEAVKSFHDPRVRIYSIRGYRRYEMLNRGITLAKGLYLNFLFPSDFYIHREALKHMMALAIDHHNPHLLYCGCLLRDGRSEAKVLFRPLTLELLRRGQQPTSLQSCWFRVDVFRELGKFEPDYGMRGGFEFLCRFCMRDERFRVVPTSRVFTDYDLRRVSRGMIVRHFIETWQILYKHFGIVASVRWLFLQKDSKRFFKLWLRSLRVAFLGRQP